MTICDDCGADLKRVDDCICAYCGGDFCTTCAKECACKEYICDDCRDKHMESIHGQKKLPLAEVSQ